MELSLKYFRKLLNNLIFTLTGFAFLLSVLLITLLSVPTYIYRLLVCRVLAPTFNKKLGKALNLAGSNFGVELVGEEENRKSKLKPPPKCTTVLTNCYVEGSVDFENFLERVNQNWIKRREEDGSLRYPEFQQYVKGWMGYLFWKLDENFDLNNHLKKHIIDPTSSEIECEQFLSSKLEELLNRRFPPKRSPWEFHLIYNYRNTDMLPSGKEMTVFVFKIHHCLADGFSIFNAFFEGLFGVPISDCQLATPQKQTTNQRHSIAKIVTNYLIFPLKACRDLGLGFILFVLDSPQTPCNVPEERRTGKQFFCRSEMIPIHKVKKVKDTFRVSFTSVLFSSISAGITSAFKAKSFSGAKAIPSGIPIPLKRNKNKLRNHITAAMFQIPVDENLTPPQRLSNADKHFRFGIQPFFPAMGGFIWKLSLVNIYPVVNFIHRHKPHVATACSNFPGSSVALSLNGHKVITKEFGFGLPPDIEGAVFTVISYDGYIRLGVTTESAAMDRVELEKLVGTISEEIDRLYVLATTTRGNELKR